MRFLKIILLSLLVTTGSYQLFAQTPSAKVQEAILEVLSSQEAAWNRGDLDAFMVGYWESDSLSFVGSRGLTRGWATTLANYKQSYPDRAAMGQLEFRVLHLRKLQSKTVYMVGAWKLTRPEKGDIGGHFSLIWQKKKGKWVIVADHSS